MTTAHPAVDPWAQLAELRTKAHDDGPARIRFGAALRAFHEAGWTYRQLGTATGVSHEYVRLAILELPAGAPTDLGILVPPRTRRLDVLPVRELDPALVHRLQALFAAAMEADPGARTPSGIKPAVADYFAALYGASQAGWDAYSLAHALGSHPKAIFKFIAQHERHGERPVPALPPAPHREEQLLWRASRPAVPLVHIPAEDAQELRRLEAAFTETPSPAAPTHRYLALLGAWYLLGANREELQSATGQNWETIRKRLVRGGYMAGQPRSARRNRPV